ncbi:hypothetical protein Pelo_396 [Pelomyxa schiedti]|nr:hypothetical protein Pelo_396 [Pelomyxa schiedti]
MVTHPHHYPRRVPVPDDDDDDVQVHKPMVAVTRGMPYKYKSIVDKACRNVLIGLLRGGNLDLAEKFVKSGESCTNERVLPPSALPTNQTESGSGPVHPVHPVLRWPGAPGSLEDQDMKENMKGDASLKSLLCVCRDTPAEAVKWFVEWSGIREPWEILGMFSSAVEWGNSEVAKWLVTKFNLAEVFDSETMIFNVTEMIERGRCPALVKWWQAEFPSHQLNVCFLPLTCNPFASVELCQWVKDHAGSSFPPLFLTSATNPRCLRWAIEEFSLSPTEGCLNNAAAMGDAEVVEWMVLEKRVAPTPTTFIKACGAATENLGLVKWLVSQKLTPPSPRVLEEALQEALSHNNTRIADWLELTFQAMSVINTNPVALVRICVKLRDENLAGLTWFLQHAVLSQVPERSVVDAIHVTKHLLSAAFLLVDSFHVSLEKSSNSDTLLSLLREVFERGNVSDLKRMHSLCPLSARTISYSLPFSRIVRSAKSIKWLVSHIGVEFFKKNGNYTWLLRPSIASNKVHCTEWLIDTLDLNMSQVMQLASFCGEEALSFEVPTMKLLVRKFPDIDIREFMGQVASFSASTVALCMDKLSLTPQEIEEFCSEEDILKDDVRLLLLSRAKPNP